MAFAQPGWAGRQPRVVGSPGTTIQRAPTITGSIVSVGPAKESPPPSLSRLTKQQGPIPSPGLTSPRESVYPPESTGGQSGQLPSPLTGKKTGQLVVQDIATGEISHYPDVTNPKLIGPGNWYSIHKRAIRARTRVEQEHFIQDMLYECWTFPCLHCRGHCKAYIEDNPMEDYVDKRLVVDGEVQPDGLSMFYWTVEFHNAVNIRINKQTMAWAEALNLFSKDPETCSQECEDAGISPTALAEAQMEPPISNLSVAVVSSSPSGSRGIPPSALGLNPVLNQAPPVSRFVGQTSAGPNSREASLPRR